MSDKSIQIIVADKGFVFIGYVTDCDDGEVIMTDARNLRRWGTTQGLGELVTGPTDSTIHDHWGRLKTRPIIRLDVEGGWEEILKKGRAA